MVEIGGVEYWSVQEVAAYVGVTDSTIRSYAARDLMPKPDLPVGRTPLWLPETIKKWKAERPGKIGRPRKQK